MNTEKLIKTNQKILKKLADALLEHETIENGDINEILGSNSKPHSRSKSRKHSKFRKEVTEAAKD